MSTEPTAVAIGQDPVPNSCQNDIYADNELAWRYEVIALLFHQC